MDRQRVALPPQRRGATINWRAGFSRSGCPATVAVRPAINRACRPGANWWSVYVSWTASRRSFPAPDAQPGAAAPGAEAEPEFVRTGAHSMALGLLCTAQLIELVDVTVVNVMQHDLQVAPDSLSWVIDAYTVVFAGALPLGSRVGRTDTGRFRTRARHGPTRGGSARARHGQRAHR